MLPDPSFFPMLFKRKSFHLFKNIWNSAISNEEISEIYLKFKEFAPLFPDIRTEIKIVPAKETSCKRGQEYCILLYSEIKENYLQNIGYIGEQLDLYLVSQNIGTLWFGIGKPEESRYLGLDFVIMIAISKVPDDRKFRKDMFKSKRKPIDEIWQGEPLDGVTELVRFAPSACNTQPWIVERSNDSARVFRYKKPGKRGIMPADLVSFYNRIDIGIFLCILELCFQARALPFRRRLFLDSGFDAEKTLNAEYHWRL